MTKLIYEDKVSSEFIAKVKDVSRRLNINPNWLMAIIHFESAGSFSPSCRNKLGYTGLIQFGKSASKRIGTTTDKLAKMTAVQQLEYVYKYYRPYKRNLNSYVDLYLATLFPVSVGKPDDFVLQARGLPASKVAKSNPIFDYNKNNEITVGEVRRKMLSRIPTNWHHEFKPTNVSFDFNFSEDSKKKAKKLLIFAIIGTGVYFAFKNQEIINKKFKTLQL